MKRDANQYAKIAYISLGVGIGLLAFVAAAVILTRPAPPVSYAPMMPPNQANEALIGEESQAPATGAYPKFGLPYIESGYRFQFSRCTGTPGNLVVKSGKYFLLDNRDAQAHIFAFAGQSHSIGAYGAAVAAIWKTGTFQITCDGGGSSKVTVEK
jgi:hypothetical protein